MSDAVIDPIVETAASEAAPARRLATRRTVVVRPETRRRSPDARGHRSWRRPDLVTGYDQQMSMLDTPAKRRAMAVLVLLAVTGTWWLGEQLLLEFATAAAFAIGAIGLNIVTGYAGQVSLGHAFFLGVGAFTAAVIGGDPRPGLMSLGLNDMLIWLPAAGLVAGVFGALVAPIALRLRGLYLAIVTLGLVFIGQYVFNQWSAVSGGEGVGRPAARPRLLGLDLTATGEILGVTVTGNQRMWLVALTLLVIAGVAAKNIVRSDAGRSFAAVRDRDQAAEVIGVDLTRTKIVAFTISAIYGGVAGALLYGIVGVVDPASFGLQLSVALLAMVLIGGPGTIAGGILGALFLQFLGPVSGAIAERGERVLDLLNLSPSVLESVLGGAILIIFLLFEPTGLIGLWRRVQTYWKGWPFTY